MCVCVLMPTMHFAVYLMINPTLSIFIDLILFLFLLIKTPEIQLVILPLSPCGNEHEHGMCVCVFLCMT